ncbi:GPI anchored cell wall protein [Diplocarpon rosae]|nr:GPI anchored cell wall protein [Diplocarpon rosae]
MLSLTSLTAGLVAALLIDQTSAHFLLKYPETFSSNTLTPFHVSGDAIALQSTHPDTKWLFRATLGTPTSGNWTALSPAIAQSNLGEFCRRDIEVPASWVGMNGTIGIAADSPDGVLYQCAAVTYVAGAATATPSACSNATGVTATYVADTVLSSLPASSTPTADSTTTTSATSATKSSSASSVNALATYLSPGFAAFLWVGVVGSATFLTCLL